MSGDFCHLDTERGQLLQQRLRPAQVFTQAPVFLALIGKLIGQFVQLDDARQKGFIGRRFASDALSNMDECVGSAAKGEGGSVLWIYVFQVHDFTFAIIYEVDHTGRMPL